MSVLVMNFQVKAVEEMDTYLTSSRSRLPKDEHILLSSVPIHVQIVNVGNTYCSYTAVKTQKIRLLNYCIEIMKKISMLTFFIISVKRNLRCNNI